MKYIFSLIMLLALGATELRAIEQRQSTKIQINVSSESDVQPLVETKTLQTTGPLPQDMTFDNPVKKVLPVTSGASNWCTDNQFLESLAGRGVWQAIEVTDKKRTASTTESCKEEYVWVHDNKNIRAGFYYIETVQKEFVESVIERFGGDLLDHRAHNQRPGIPPQKCWRPCPKLSSKDMTDLVELFTKKRAEMSKRKKVKKTNRNQLKQEKMQEPQIHSQQLPDQDVILNTEERQQQQYQQQKQKPSVTGYPANPHPFQQQYQQQYAPFIGSPANPHPFQQQNYKLKHLKSPFYTHTQQP